MAIITECCSGNPNEFLLYREDYSDGTACAVNTPSYWTAVEVDATLYTPTTAEVRYNTPASYGIPNPPNLNSCVANHFLQSGSNETTPMKFYKEGGFSQLFVRWYQYFKGTPDFPFPASLKLFRAGTSAGGGVNFFLEMNYDAGAPYHPFYIYDSVVDEQLYTGNPSFSTFTSNRWYKFEVYLLRSGNNVADGRYVMWRDGVKIADSGPTITRKSESVLDYFWIGANNSWGSGAGWLGSTTVPFDGNYFTSGIEIYSQLPNGMHF